MQDTAQCLINMLCQMLRPKWCVDWTTCKSIILAVVRDFLMNCRLWPVEQALKSLWCEGQCELSVCGVKSARWLMLLTGLSASQHSVVTGQWSLISDHWSVVTGQWSLVSGHWSVISDLWSMTSDHWSVITGQWLLVSGHQSVTGQWSVVTDQRSLVSDQWSLVSGHWSVICGQWSVISGHWSLVSDHWSVVIGQWSLVSGQWSLVTDLWSLITGHCVCVCVWQERTTDDCKESECLKELLSARTHEYIEEVLQPHFGGMITFVKDCEVAAERGNIDHLKAQESELRL